MSSAAIGHGFFVASKTSKYSRRIASHRQIAPPVCHGRWTEAWSVATASGSLNPDLMDCLLAPGFALHDCYGLTVGGWDGGWAGGWWLGGRGALHAGRKGGGTGSSSAAAAIRQKRPGAGCGSAATFHAPPKRQQSWAQRLGQSAPLPAPVVVVRTRDGGDGHSPFKPRPLPWQSRRPLPCLADVRCLASCNATPRLSAPPHARPPRPAPTLGPHARPCQGDSGHDEGHPYQVGVCATRQHPTGGTATATLWDGQMQETMRKDR